MGVPQSLVELLGPVGPPPPEETPLALAGLSFQVSGGYIQWRLGEGEWTNLVSLASLKVDAGNDGQEVSLQVSGGYIQWRLGAGEWTNLVSLASLKGDAGNDGQEVGLQVSGGYIQWRLGAGEWTNLVSLASLKGDAGNDGQEVGLQVSGGYIQWRLGEGEWTNLVSLASLKGDAGNDGFNPGIRFTRDTSGYTMADPGSGGYRRNHSTLASATAFWFSDLDAVGSNAETWLQSHVAGDRLNFSTAQGGAGGELVVRVTGAAIDRSGFWELPLVVLHAGAMPATAAITVSPAGQEGEPGTPGATGPGFDVGDFKFAFRASAPTGWLICNGDTIGDASSGATHAGAGFEALFTLLWTDAADADLPVLTSGGAGSTRGASAAADWAAHKRLTLPNMTATGLFPRAKQSGRGLASVQEDAFQNITGTISGGQENLSGSGVFANGSAGSSLRPSNGSASTRAVNFDASTVARTSDETRPKNIAVLPLIRYA